MPRLAGPMPGTERAATFERVFDQVYVPLQQYLRRRVGSAAVADADDLVADVLLVVWRRLDDVPPDAAVPWCLGVARKVLGNHRRSADRGLRLVTKIAAEPTDDVQSGPGGGGGPADAAVHAAIAELGEVDQEIVRLWAWDGLAPREIAVVTDLTPNAVSLRLSRARKRLAGSLSDHLRAGRDGGDAPPRQEVRPPGHDQGVRADHGDDGTTSRRRSDA